MSDTYDRRNHGRAASPDEYGGRRPAPPLRAPLPLKERPASRLPAPSDWTFELIEQYHDVIRHEGTKRLGISKTIASN